MPTNAKTPPSSSHKQQEDPHLTIPLPTSWAALPDPDLHHLARLALIPSITPDEIKTLFLLTHIPHLTTTLRRHLSPLSIALALPHLDFLDQPPTLPVRPQRLTPHGPTAVHPYLQDTPFSLYLQAENYYRGYLDTRSPEAILALRDLLYPPTKQTPVRPAKEVPQRHVYLLLLWMVGLHAALADLYPDLFSRPAADADPSLTDPRTIMNTQIRALTGGDVTKTATVLQTETHTALTELNARAREAHEAHEALKKTH